MANPLHQSCLHFATPEEQRRDPTYTGCHAQPDQPCHWASRYDGLSNPPFHTERLEAAAQQTPFAERRDTLTPEAFREAVLETGLV